MLDLIQFFYGLFAAASLSPAAWMAGFGLAVFGYTWTTKVANTTAVAAAHVNLLQTEKLDRDGAIPITGANLEGFIIISPYTPKDNTYKGNAHCHTTNSDGTASPADLAAAYAAAGYDFLAITDHDVLTADTATAGLLYIPGVEENTNEGDLLNLGATANVVAETPAQTVLDAVIAQGSVPILAHPGYTIAWTKHQLDRLNGFVGLEVYNYECSGLAGGPTYETLWDYLLSEGKHVVALAGDDAHGLASVGNGWIHVFADSATAANILASLRTGNFYSSTGPTITIAASSTEMTITTPAAATIAFIGQGGATLQTSASVTTATYTFTGNEKYVRVLVTRDSDSKLAWTNPVYIKRHFVDSEPQGQRVYGNADVVNGVLTANQYSVNLTTLDAPGAPTAALGTGAGNVDNGVHSYKMTFVTAVGETSLGTASGDVTVVDKTANGKVELTALPVDSTGFATSRKLYRTAAGGANYYLLTTISNNVQTTYSDNIADASLGAVVMNNYENHSGGMFYIGALPAGYIGDSSTCFGYRAGRLNVSGDLTAVGIDAGYNNSSGDASVFGSLAGKANTTGNICAFGYAAGTSNKTGPLSAFGYKAGYYSTGTTPSVMVGWNAGYYITSGNITAIGGGAGYGAVTTNAPATDTYGILIGYNANRSVATATVLTNYIGIGYGTLVDKSNQVKIGNSSMVEFVWYGAPINSQTVETHSGAGALDLTTYITHIVTTGTDALTLADGQEGQEKIVVMKTDGGDGTLTPTTPAGFATITFTAVGQSCRLIFTNAAWHLIGHNGCTVA
jgi:hypothetical protein